MIITGMRVKRWIDADKVRTICIEHDWYTQGTVDEYTNMLNKVGEDGHDMSDALYFIIAEDIYNHTNLDKMCNEYGVDEEECIRIILSELINESWNNVEITVDETR